MKRQKLTKEEVIRSLREGRIISAQAVAGSTRGAGVIIDDPARLEKFARALADGVNFEVAMHRYGPDDREGGEGCILHADGSISDAEFHAEFLGEDDSGEPKPDADDV